MIIFKDKDEVIEAYKEEGKPLSPLFVHDLDEIDAELRDLKVSTELVVINLQCRICNHTETAIVPLVADLENLECANCENLSAQEREA